MKMQVIFERELGITIVPSAGVTADAPTTPAASPAPKMTEKEVFPSSSAPWSLRNELRGKKIIENGTSLKRR
jgi:hypothetical protein